MTTRLELFNTFSTNLGFYRKNNSNHFLCPLCLRSFTRDAVESKQLTKAHIIAEKLGGKYWTLACKQCNGDVGSKIESHEVARVNLNRALSGESDEKTRVNFVSYIEKDELGLIQADMRVDTSQSEPR
jgi:5-methylcytosine-specific restriction endonuclease McrA